MDFLSTDDMASALRSEVHQLELTLFRTIAAIEANKYLIENHIPTANGNRLAGLHRERVELEGLVSGYKEFGIKNGLFLVPEQQPEEAPDVPVHEPAEGPGEDASLSSDQ